MEKKKVLWSEGLQESIKQVLPTEDNRLILIKWDQTTIEMFKGY